MENEGEVEYIEIMKLMGERRKYKSKALDKYKEVHRTIKRKLREGKQKLSDKFEEIEMLQEKHDSFNIYKAIQEVMGPKHKQYLTKLKYANGTVITDLKGKLKI